MGIRTPGRSSGYRITGSNLESHLEGTGCRRLNEETLSNQTPSEPQRLGQSEFQLRKVDITLGRATITQIVRFCEALRDESTGSVVRDLQFYDPETQGTRETWLSQMTLTQVIFSPKSDS